MTQQNKKGFINAETNEFCQLLGALLLCGAGTIACLELASMFYDNWAILAFVAFLNCCFACVIQRFARFTLRVHLILFAVQMIAACVFCSMFFTSVVLAVDYIVWVAFGILCSLCRRGVI